MATARNKCKSPPIKSVSPRQPALLPPVSTYVLKLSNHGHHLREREESLLPD